MTNTHYDDVMNIIMEVADGDIDTHEAFSRVHEHVKQEAPQHGPQTKLVIGIADVHYENEALEKDFTDDVIVAMRPDGSAVVLLQDKGVKPVVYITGGADITVLKDDDNLELHAIKGEELLSLRFQAIQYSSGLD